MAYTDVASRRYRRPTPGRTRDSLDLFHVERLSVQRLMYGGLRGGMQGHSSHGQSLVDVTATWMHGRLALLAPRHPHARASLRSELQVDGTEDNGRLADGKRASTDSALSDRHLEPIKLRARQAVCWAPSKTRVPELTCKDFAHAFGNGNPFRSASSVPIPEWAALP